RPSRIRLAEGDRAEFLRQFATALKAQLPLMTALQAVGQQNPHPTVKLLTRELSEMVKSGKSLSAAFTQYPRIFGRLHVAMVAAGESAGSLDDSMTQLANLTENDLEARRSIMTAALYPLFVLGLGLISLAIVITWILPKILQTLAADVPVLPWPTRAIMAFSDFLQTPTAWICLGALAVVVLGFFRWKYTPTGRYVWDNIKLHIPVLRTVQRKWAVSRFARTLSTLSRGGIHILDALQIVRNTLGNEVLAREVDKTIRRVRGGESLAQSLNQSGRFPPLLVQIVAVGEQTGQLADLLLQAAEAFDRDTQVAIKRFMSVFPATLIVILALIIGFIVAATLLPIVQIETAIPGL
ncbi:MAG: type II secretion system F family protein, partial [Sedimentisphaerales bacterium]|nr:type II secretion system F family protein [Sedimentisphaerales bacterium]